MSQSFLISRDINLSHRFILESHGKYSEKKLATKFTKGAMESFLKKEATFGRKKQDLINASVN